MSKLSDRWTSGLVATTVGWLASCSGQTQPPEHFLLETAGQLVKIELDKPCEIAVQGDKATVVLRKGPVSPFDFEKIRFDYPAGMQVAFQESAQGVKAWTLDGEHATIIVMLFSDTQHLGEILGSFLDGQGKTFGDRITKKDKSQFRILDKDIESTVLDLAGDVPLRQEICALQHGEDVVVLALLDAPTEAGKRSEEADAAFGMLSATFQPSKRVN